MFFKFISALFLAPGVTSLVTNALTFCFLLTHSLETQGADKKPEITYSLEPDEAEGTDNCCKGPLAKPDLKKIPIAEVIAEYERQQSKPKPPESSAKLAALTPNDQAGTTVTWERVYDEVFKKNCQECHGSVIDNKFVMRGFVRFDKYNTTLASVEPGKPEESRLFRHIKPKDKSVKLMPPEDSGFLTAEQIELVRQWILQGAKGPRISRAGGNP